MVLVAVMFNIDVFLAAGFVVADAESSSLHVPGPG